MVKTAKHHYVPQCYLKNFTTAENADQIYGYKKDGNLIKTNILNIAAKNNFYTFTDKTTGQETNIVEEMFAQLEGAACPVINSIITKRSLDLSDEARGALAQFTAFLSTRNLSYDKQQRQMTADLFKQETIERAKHEEAFRKHFEDAGVTFENEKEFQELRNAVLDFDNHFKVEMKGGDGYFMKVAIELAMDLTYILYYKEWHLLISNGSGVFVTSDNPVTLWSVKGIPPQYNAGFMYASILLTLSPQVCLLMRNTALSKKVFGIRMWRWGKNMPPP
jgi:hypothetical protein